MDPIVLLEYQTLLFAMSVSMCRLLFFQFIVKSHDYVRHSMYVKTWENHVSNIHVLHALVCVCVCVSVYLCAFVCLCVLADYKLYHADFLKSNTRFGSSDRLRIMQKERSYT